MVETAGGAGGGFVEEDGRRQSGVEEVKPGQCFLLGGCQERAPIITAILGENRTYNKGEDPNKA